MAEEKLVEREKRVAAESQAERAFRLHTSGVETFRRECTPIFPGFDEGVLARRHLAVANFHRTMRWKFYETIVPFFLGAEKEEFLFLLAERDYPLHCTMLEGEGHEPLSKELCEATASDGRLTKPMLALKGTHLVFEEFVLDERGTFMLMAREIPKPVLVLREALSSVYMEHGLKPLPLPQLHSVVARVRQYPHEDWRFEWFLETCYRLREKLASNPFDAQVNEVVMGLTSWEFLTKY